jgi:hypothetical protein
MIRSSATDIYDLIDRDYGVMVWIVTTATLSDLRAQPAEPSLDEHCP